MPHPALALAAAAAALVTAAVPVRADDPTGAQLYAKQCASCHGANGQGTKKYPRSLAGDRSVKQLAAYIGESMPEDDPGSCAGPNADKVAAFMHDAFYSPVARERNRPARVELARLTVRQFENGVADVIGSFRAKAEYDLPDGGSRAEPVKYARKDWEGAVFAPTTGDYEFVLSTPPDSRGRIWLNDFARPFVDMWVRSGDQSEQRATIRLLGGRAYRLKVEAVKIKKNTVNKDIKPKPEDDTPPNVVMKWVPPNGVLEVVPDRFLLTTRVPEVYVVATRFPPDDRSLGWERGTAVSKAWDAAATDAALDAAGYVAARLRELGGVPADGPDRADKAKQFCRTFAARAFRRPLADDVKAMYIDRAFAGNADIETAVKRVVLFVLKSPRFLYREPATTDGYAVASRLALALWDSVPDQALTDLAAKGKLATREEVSAQAARMLADPRAHAKVRGFFHHWLNVEHAGDLAKDPKRFPGFDPAAVADLRASLDLFLDDAVWGADPDFRRLLRSDELFLNGRLAKFYGADLPADAPFTKVELDPGQRAGVVTHPFLLAAFAYTGESSPIHRGVFLARGVLGQTMRPPPEAVAPLSPALHPGLSTRERVATQTKSQACMTCHGVINPLGFTLENFDAAGRFRDRDNGKPVDPVGGYFTRDGKAVELKGAVALANFLADSPEVHAAFAEQVFHHVAQQPVRAYGPTTRADLTAAFTKSRFDVRKLFTEAATVAAIGPSQNDKVTR